MSITAVTNVTTDVVYNKLIINTNYKGNRTEKH